MPLKNVSRRSFLTTVTGGIAAVAVADALPFENIYRHIDNKSGNSIKLGVFDVDATPPVGSHLTYDPMINSSDLGLRAKGIVITGAGQPIVLCAVDWIGISNESQDVFKEAMAEAAATTPERVVIHTLHLHDAPICDFTAERLLTEKNLHAGCFDGTFARVLIKRLQKSIADSLLKLQDVTHVGLGKAPVFQVASNRRVDKTDGKVGVMRGSSCSDPRLRNLPEGVIDPDVSLISFWNKNTPLAVLSFYATHPQSYYRTGVANPDFPGIARYLRQLEVPDALHVHFNGAGGNIAAGKYNDGSHEMRYILAQRLADGMKRAWEKTQRYSVNSDNVTWSVIPVLLPYNPKTADIEKEMATKDGIYLANHLGRLGWYKRTLQQKAIEFACMGINNARIFFMPGELFVEYQLAAKAKAPDKFVAMAAYGDYGPFYIGTKDAYKEGGYEILSSPVTEEAESVIMRAIDDLYSQSNKVWNGF